MYIQIYQIAPERDTDKCKFRPLDQQPSKWIDEGIYDRVFSGDVDCDQLEDVFCMFNTEGHRLHRGHSLSVSDVVEVQQNGTSTFHYCDSVGFKPIEFHPERVRVTNNLIRVVVVEPGRKPYESEVINTLRGQQTAVNGYIEHINNGDGTYLVCNEEGKLQGLPANRRYNGDILVGPFFIAGAGDYELCSLSDEQAAAYMERFAEPEQIDQSEVNAHIGFSVFSLGGY